MVGPTNNLAVTQTILFRKIDPAITSSNTTTTTTASDIPNPHPYHHPHQSLPLQKPEPSLSASVALIPKTLSHPTPLPNTMFTSLAVNHNLPPPPNIAAPITNIAVSTPLQNIVKTSTSLDTIVMDNTLTSTPVKSSLIINAEAVSRTSSSLSSSSSSTSTTSLFSHDNLLSLKPAILSTLPVATEIIETPTLDTPPRYSSPISVGDALDTPPIRRTLETPPPPMSMPSSPLSDFESMYAYLPNKESTSTACDNLNDPLSHIFKGKRSTTLMNSTRSKQPHSRLA